MNSTAKVSASQVFGSPVLFLAFGFGSGLAPRAPGTAGTVAAVPLYLLFAQFPSPLYLALLVVVAVAGVWICQRASEHLGDHDHPGIVWDEFAGFLLTMIPAPLSWVWVLTGFVLFRLFDIWKPWPISWADRNVKGGLGIMLDDLMAGIFAGLALFVIIEVLG